MSLETGERDPLLEAWRSLAERARPTDACPDPERIWAAAWGESPLAERREVVDHLAACPSCAEAWRLARAVGTAVDAPTRREGRQERRPWLRALGLAAAALLVAMIGLQVVRWQRGNDDAEFRNGTGDSIVSLLDEETPQPREDLVLRWQAPPGAVAYDVRLTDASLNLLARGRELSHPVFRVPPDSLDGIPDGATLFWQVEAIFPDASRLVSQTFVVRVDDPGP